MVHELTLQNGRETADFDGPYAIQRNGRLNRQGGSMKRVVIYARVSTQDQELQNQITQLQAYASGQEWTVCEVITDIGSGAKGREERTGLDRVFQLAHQRKFDLVLFWALDRFSREGSRKTIGYLTQLESFGVGFHSYTESYLSTLGIFSDTIISLLATLGRQEAIRVSERTKAGLQRAVANGKQLGRPRTDSRRIAQAKELKSQGLSLSAVAERMGVTRSRVHQMVHS